MKGRWVPHADIGKRASTTRIERAQRNRMICALCRKYPVADVARLTGFSRMRIYQICREFLQKRGAKNSSD